MKIYHAENPKLKNEDVVVDADIGFDFRSISHRRYLESIKDNDHYANSIAQWLFERNNSLKYKFRRNRYLILYLLRNDPQFLFKKIYGFIRRRIKVYTLKHKNGYGVTKN